MGCILYVFDKCLTLPHVPTHIPTPPHYLPVDHPSTPSPAYDPPPPPLPPPLPPPPPPPPHHHHHHHDKNLNKNKIMYL